MEIILKKIKNGSALNIQAIFTLFFRIQTIFYVTQSLYLILATPNTACRLHFVKLHIKQPTLVYSIDHCLTTE